MEAVALRGFRLGPSGARFFSLSHNGCARMGGRDRGAARDSKKDAATILEEERNGIFRVLDIGKPQPRSDERQGPRFTRVAKVGPQRHTQMKPDQDWGAVWPAARTFHPAVVPLPLRQGVIQTKKQVVPSKYANTELMKIPNFLHLTPPVVKRHCAAIQRFCTAWPAGLDTEEDTDKHFPLQVITSDYLNSSSSLRDRRSRIVVVRFKLASLQLDDHARDKIIRLLDHRYDHECDLVTLTADRCPYRGQNLDYAKYLLTALYFESCRTEDWELKEEPDREQFELRPEQKGDEYSVRLEAVLNRGEDEDSLRLYKEAARKRLNLPADPVQPQIVSN